MNSIMASGAGKARVSSLRPLLTEIEITKRWRRMADVQSQHINRCIEDFNTIRTWLLRRTPTMWGAVADDMCIIRRIEERLATLAELKRYTCVGRLAAEWQVAVCPECSSSGRHDDAVPTGSPEHSD